MIRGRHVVIGLAAIILCGALLAQARSIGGVGIAVRPAVWDGRCPATLHFTATINANRWPVLVSYQWERSDGATGERRRLEIRSPHQRVVDTWRLGGGGQRMEVWERLHVVAPTNVGSAQARVRVVCR